MTPSQLSPRSLAINRRVLLVSSLITAGLGASVLVGWFTHISILTTVLPGFVSMKVNTAIGFVLVGSAVLLLAHSNSETDWRRNLATSLGALATLNALLVLIEYALNVDLHVDQFLWNQSVDTTTVIFPGRMSPVTAFNFVCLGLSIVSLRLRRAKAAPQLFAMIALVIGFSAIIGYFYGARALYAAGHYTAVAFNTGAGFVAAAVAVLCLRPDRGLVGVLNLSGVGGMVARRFVPVAIVMPVAVGGIRIWAQHHGAFGTETGLALYCLTNIFSFIALTWWNAAHLVRVEASLRESAGRYQFLADTMPQIVWTSKPDGNLDYFNRAWYEYTGMTFEQTKDWGWKTVIHPEDLQECVDRWTRSLTTGVDYEVEYRFKRASDGVYRWHLGRAHPLRNDQGNIVQWVGTCTDIDDQKRARELLEMRIAERTKELARARMKIQEVLDAATCVSIIATTLEGIITVFNKGAERMLGYSAEEMVGKRTPAIIHLGSEIEARSLELSKEFGRPITGFEVLVEYARQGRDEHREWTYVRKDGETLRVGLDVTPTHNEKGEINGFLGVAIDVTKRKQAEASLLESRERLALASEAAHIGIWDWDIGSNALLWDSRMYELYGLHEDDFSGVYAAWRKAVHSDDATKAEAEINAALSGTKDFDTEFRVVWPNGEVREIEAHAIVERGPDGSAQRMIGVNLDVTERKRTEVQLMRSAAIVASSHDAIISKTLDGTIVTWNPAAQSLYGYTPEEAIGKSILTLIPADRKDEEGKIIARLKADEFIDQYESVRMRKDGSLVDVSLTISAVKNTEGVIVGASKIARDITERKRAEAALLAASNAAENANRAKSEFLANMSHEIRTPMNGIISMTDLALDTELTRTQREYLEIVKYSSDALLRLINDILDFSKIEAGQLSLEVIPFDLRDCLEKTVGALTIRADRKGLKLICRIDPDVPGVVIGDPMRLRQVLINLLDNAIKFTNQGEVSLTVNISGVTNDDLWLDISVTDTGIGIPRDKQDVIFTAFSQADSSTTRNYGGTGLGLTISSRIIEQMGGRLTVESVENQGSTFRFTVSLKKEIDASLRRPVTYEDLTKLPISSRTEIVERTEEPSNASVTGRNLRVLVVDDSAVNRLAAKAILTNQGNNVRLAGNGREAVEIVERERFDLILMDVQMPELDGFGATAQIRDLEKKSGRRTAIVAVTARAMPGDKERCLAAGMDGYIAKPIKKEELTGLLLKFAPGVDPAAGSEFLAHSDSGFENFGLPTGGAPPRDVLSTAEFSQQAGEHVEPLPVDLDRLRSASNGDPNLMRKLVNLYLSEGERLIVSLNGAIEAGSAEKIEQAAHSLASSSLTLGIVGVVPPLLELERMGKICELSGAPAIYAKVHKALKSASDFLLSSISAVPPDDSSCPRPKVETLYDRPKPTYTLKPNQL